jgi:hypothetical protein
MKHKTSFPISASAFKMDAKAISERLKMELKFTGQWGGE